MDVETALLSTSIAERLKEGSYECMVCQEPISTRHKVWGCTVCWALFHIPCLTCWAKSTATFRCPHCQSVHKSEVLDTYKCFCGKLVNPPVDPFIPQHSCGTTCGKQQPDQQCPHPCPIPCHPGPCPKCPRTRIQHCYCGQSEKVVGCSSGEAMFGCGGPCGKFLSCGKHVCPRTCHGVGQCPPCEATHTSTCFCGNEVKSVRCEMPLTHSCGKVCSKKLDCGVHDCMMKCHEGPCIQCDRFPRRVTSCPCGQTPLWKLYATTFKDSPPRTTCLDPIPTCQGTCGKKLLCQYHTCQAKCHDGPCPPCMEIVTLGCRCGAGKGVVSRCFVTYMPKTEWPQNVPQPPPEPIDLFAGKGKKGNTKGSSSSAPVVTLVEWPFKCTKKCTMKRTCGRHQCGEECCPVLPILEGRIPSPGEDVDIIAEYHQCTLLCKKKLSPCGHLCQQLCHSGLCPPCPNVQYTDLPCACGKTIMEPPIPCGTKPPACPHPCSIPRPCGHPPCHECHEGGQQACPTCAFPTPKRCSSHGVVMDYNMPCYLKEVSCGKKCMKPNISVKEGVCQRPCHAGPC